MNSTKLRYLLLGSFCIAFLYSIDAGDGKKRSSGQLIPKEFTFTAELSPETLDRIAKDGIKVNVLGEVTSEDILKALKTAKVHITIDPIGKAAVTTPLVFASTFAFGASGYKYTIKDKQPTDFSVWGPAVAGLALVGMTYALYQLISQEKTPPDTAPRTLKQEEIKLDIIHPGSRKAIMPDPQKMLAKPEISEVK